MCGVYWHVTCAHAPTQVSARACVRARNRKNLKYGQKPVPDVALTPYPHYGFPTSIGSVQSRHRGLCPCTVGRGHRILSTIIWAQLVAWVYELLLSPRGTLKTAQISTKTAQNCPRRRRRRFLMRRRRFLVFQVPATPNLDFPREITAEITSFITSFWVQKPNRSGGTGLKRRPPIPPNLHGASATRARSWFLNIGAQGAQYICGPRDSFARRA